MHDIIKISSVFKYCGINQINKEKQLKNNQNLIVNMKCSVCSKAIETTFLNKILGTYVKNGRGKQHPVCFECQKKFASKEEILKAIK